jgi:hypothetical protein
MALKEVEIKLDKLVAVVGNRAEAYEEIIDTYVELLQSLKENLTDIPKNFSLSLRLGKQVLNAIDSACNFASNLKVGDTSPLLVLINNTKMIINDSAHSIIRDTLSHYDVYTIALQLRKDKKWTLMFNESIEKPPEHFAQILRTAINNKSVEEIRLNNLKAIDPKLFRIILQSGLVKYCDSNSAKTTGTFIETDTRITTLALQNTAITLLNLRHILFAICKNTSLIRVNMPNDTIFKANYLAKIEHNKSILYFSLNFKKHESIIGNQIVAWNNSNIRLYKEARQQLSAADTNCSPTCPAPSPK